MKKTKLTSLVSLLKSNHQRGEFGEELELEIREQLKAVCYYASAGYAAPLFLIFWIGDFVLYPEHKFAMGIVRLTAAVALIVSSLFIKRLKNLESIEAFSSLLLQIAAYSILSLLVVINDPHTNYYTGLFLVIIGSAISFSLKAKTMALNFIMMLSGYMVVEFFILKHGKDAVFSTLILFGMMLIGLVTRSIMNRALTNEFNARKNLSNEINERNKIIEAKTAENVRYKSLEKQFSPQVIKQISAGSLSLDDLRESFIAVAFFDIVSSTQKANEIDSLAYQKALNLFMEETIRIMLSYDVTIGGFLGDGILGFTNQPFQQNNYVDRMLLAALEINSMIEKKQSEFRVYWKDEFALTTGISVGPAKVGFFGGRASFKHYTAVGPVVNKAKRVGSCCQKNDIFIDENTFKASIASGYDSTFSGKYPLKGFAEDQTLYRLNGKTNSTVISDDGEELEVLLNDKGIYEFKPKKRAA